MSNRRDEVLSLNIGAARGLQSVLASNLGPKGTIKMLVSGSGDIKLTKDGHVLLNEMQIASPTAALIARVATAQDEITGDGTSSSVLLIGELMTLSAQWLNEKVHPAMLTEGFERAKRRALETLEQHKVMRTDPEVLLNVARTSLRTKVRPELAENLAQIVLRAVDIVREEDKPIDLLMVEQMLMTHRTDMETRLIEGLVLDHGTRHPDMSRVSRNAHILILNVSLEYEKTEVNSSVFYANAKDRQDFVEGERRHTDDRVRAIIEFKKSLCDGTDKSFVVINQKGIDIISLDMLSNAGIPALRRAKRRNMERLMRACGGRQVDSVEDLVPECLGHAGKVWEMALGEDKFTFIEEVPKPFSCTVLIKGPHKHVVTQIKDAVRDGLRAIKNAIEDKCVIPGAGAIEVALSNDLLKFATTIPGLEKIGVEVYAKALLVIPKTLARNSGFDPIELLLQLTHDQAAGHCVGVD
ncbi:MAG: T-complex protein 1 subunit zeta, partial [archaeon]|nr:T-complex protein 1 subunit zeta [archaeon]